MLYKNISGSDQHLVGFGNVDAEATIDTDVEINNQNFDLQETTKTVVAKVEETPEKTEDNPQEEN